MCAGKTYFIKTQSCMLHCLLKWRNGLNKIKFGCFMINFHKNNNFPDN